MAPVEWKSAWRLEFERRSAEEAAIRRATKRVRPQPKPRCQPAKKRVRVSRPALYCTHGPCESRVRVEGLCYRHKDLKLDRATCSVEGCTNLLYSTNNTGICRKCGRGDNLYRKLWETRIRGERPTCSFQANGMRCVQKLYRDTTTGLCCWHNPIRPGNGHYRKTKPKMEAIS